MTEKEYIKIEVLKVDNSGYKLTLNDNRIAGIKGDSKSICEFTVEKNKILELIK